LDTFDAIVVGSGPNGLVAAAILGRAGWRVAVLERAPIAGGAVRSEELTRPGYVHDNYSAFYGIRSSLSSSWTAGLNGAPSRFRSRP
jgi:phytoene dehydrogenase-like protein